MITYTFHQDRVLTIKGADKADPQKIGEALESIADINQLTPKAVVEAASKPRHPLHRYFEWDDAKAAASYRLDQARTLIRSIYRVEDDKPVQAFVSITEKSGTRYRTLDEVRSSATLRALLLEQAERDLLSFENRYRELQDVCAVVHEARTIVSSKRSRTKQETRVAA